jgi:4-amino-4-deoxy-L-arabinose transferase-like glycosyltransferase
MSSAESTPRRTLLACLVIGVVTLASWWPRMDGPIDLRWDGGAYYILGTSLAAGDGYRLLSEPGSLRSSLHPPFLPVLVAAHQLVLQTSDPVTVGHALRMSIVLASIAYAVAIFVLLREHVASAYALAASLICVIQPQYAYFSDALYAETFFALLTVLFLILQRYRSNIWCFLLSGLCAALAYEARTAGIALLAAWVADTLLRRDRRRALIAIAISAVPVISWMGWIKAVESSPQFQQPAYAYQTAPYLYFNVSYARNILTLRDPSAPELGPLTIEALLDRVWTNAKALPTATGRAVSTWDAPRLVALPLAGAVFIGLVVLVKRRQFLMLAYLALSLAAMCLTPFPKQFVRYLMPLYPLFALALFQCLALLAKDPRFRVSPRLALLRPGLPWLVVAAIGVMELTTLRNMYQSKYDDVAYEQEGRAVGYRLFYYGPVGAAFDEALGWLNRRAERTDVIAATDPQWVYLRTGLKAVLPPFELDAKKAQQLVDTVPVRYLIAETQPRSLGLGAYHRFTSVLVRENPSDWSRIWTSSNGSMVIFERNTAPRAAADSK